MESLELIYMAGFIRSEQRFKIKAIGLKRL